MAPAVSLFPGATSRIFKGGVPAVVAYGPVLGGKIINPQLASDQGIPSVEILYVDLVSPAGLRATSTTTALQPGQWFDIPPGDASNVTVNAETTGHRFSVFLLEPPVPFPPTPTPGPFPPDAPTGIANVIPSYLYKEYSDDEDLQAFVAAYNAMAQEYVDSFNEIELPVYTSPTVAGPLLDWVALGVYGIERPSLSSGRNRNLGPLNTYVFNSIAFNVQQIVGPQNVTVVTDDVFKRVITWNFFKGDGNYFDVRWLKRRIMRFLLGANGTNVDQGQSYQVSVTFGLDNQVNITLLTGVRTLTAGALFNRFNLNTMAFNASVTTFDPISPLPNAEILKEAIDSGVLQLPFQFDYVVTG